ncbi:hypothetical protein LN42_00625 [Marinitoga sp. 1137]|uniref:hypothetical protein n=1 Tax=Marinitoga sp. 1137 TaxID=1545835 RepID=UPI000950467D|nr:hypothetical protein [Marinitoga sp. 1137]APT75063.1 hypothetical protein LN42_00625 [Marinitoga sp. 1137]
MSLLSEVAFNVSLNANNYISGLRKMEERTKTFEQTINKVGTTLLTVFGGAGVIATIKNGIGLWAEQEKATLKLNFAVNQFANGNKELFRSLQNLGNELQKNIGVGNEYVENLASVGLSVGITSDKIENATKASILLSKALGVDANTLMRGFAQTMEGQVGVLGRYIPQLRNLTQEQLKSGEAIDLIIEQFGSLEDTLKNTTGSALDKLKASIGDVGEVIGSHFTPFLNKLADIMFEFANKAGETGSVIGAIGYYANKAWNQLNLLGKGFILFIGTALGMTLITKSWKLLVYSFAIGKDIITGVFSAIFSPWTLIAASIVAGLYVLRVAWKKDWGGIRTFTEDLWNNKLKPLFDAMSKLLKEGLFFVIKTSGDAWKWIRTTSLKQKVEDIGNFLKQGWEWIVITSGNFWDWIKGKTLSDVLDKMGETLKSGWDWVVGVTGEFWDWIKDTKLGSLLETLGETLKNGWKWVVHVGGELWDWIEQSALGKYMDPIKDYLKNGWEWVVKTAGKFWDYLNSKTIEEWVQATGDFLKSGWDWIIGITGDGWNWLKDSGEKFGNMIEKLKEKLKQGWDWTINIAGDFWNWIKENFNKEKFKTVWDISLNTIGNFWNNLSQWFVKEISTAWNITSNLINDITKWFVKKFETTWNITSTLLGNFANMLPDWLKDILKTYWNIELKILGTFWNTFKAIYEWMKDGIFEFKININALIPDWIKKIYNWVFGSNSENTTKTKYTPTIKEKATFVADPSAIHISGTEQQYMAIGHIPRFAGGNIAYLDRNGIVKGPGSDTSDNILAWISPGEAVIRAEAVRRYLPLLRAINNMSLPRYATATENVKGDASIIISNSDGKDSTFKKVFEDVLSQMQEDYTSFSSFLNGLLEKLKIANPEFDAAITQLQKYAESQDALNDEFEEMKKNIENSNDAFNKLKETIANEATKDLTGPAKDVFSSFSQDLPALGEVISSSFVAVMNGFMTAGEAISSILISVGSSFVAAFGSVISIGIAVGKVFGGIFKVLSPVINSILKPIFSILGSLGQLLGVVLLPIFSALKLALLPVVWAINAVIWAFDQVILWVDSLPFVGGFLSDSERTEKRKTITQRMGEYMNPSQDEYENSGSTMGQEFAATGSKNVTINNHISFERNFIISEDDRQLKELGDKLLEYFREKGVFANA